MDRAPTEIIFKQCGVFLLLMGFFAACGGSSQDSKASALVTAGGCACPSNPEEAGRLSLECYCAEFPGECVSYEKAKTTGRRCFDDSRWWLMEQTGCGRLVITTGWGLGGNTLVYDEVTHQLIGAQNFSDIGFAACNTYSYSAGVVDPCNEGTVCSLCDASGASCAPACSIEVLKSNGHGAPVYEVKDKGSLYECPDAGPGYKRPELRQGCGRVTVVTNFDSTTFASDTHEPLSVSYPGDPTCNGHWGEAEQPCADETVCSLCAGDPNVCPL